ncbi:ABC transporter substrate-binding protein [uncultured Paraglaciecola sp.]|uniref:substrate-binding periplasmic protein n=1 Tax=uncultured Paraglaciecola sp. TaxID=1765024 RepID=UPI0030D9BD36
MFEFTTFRYLQIQIFTLTMLFCSSGTLANETCLEMHVIQSVPQGFLDEKRNIVGIDFEVLQQLETYSGVCMAKRLMPIARIWKSIEQGQHDGGLVFRSANRDPLVVYAAFIRHAEIIALPRKGLKIDSYEQLHKFSIAKTRGTPLNKRFDIENKVNVVEVTNYGQLLNMLRLGHIDVVAGSAEPIFYNLAKLKKNKKDIEVGEKFVLGSREKWLQFSRLSANLEHIPKLQKAVDLMKEKGDYNRIMMKYYGRGADSNELLKLL